MITILVIAAERKDAERWMRSTGWAPSGPAHRVVYASDPRAILGLPRDRVFYVCTGRWWARPSAQSALIFAKRRGARELDDLVSILGALVGADQ